MYFLSTIQYPKESYIQLYIYIRLFLRVSVKVWTTKLNDFEYIVQMWCLNRCYYHLLSYDCNNRLYYEVWVNDLLQLYYCDCNDSNYTLTRIVSLLNSIRSLFLFYSTNWSDLKNYRWSWFFSPIIFSENEN